MSLVLERRAIFSFETEGKDNRMYDRPDSEEAGIEINVKWIYLLRLIG